ncbi:hypothetical protein MARINOS108_90173 [Marinoscillum sp. 108]|nr:hypothetical protein MARINOS108_90173 [Marinoscillum sp. 108]
MKCEFELYGMNSLFFLDQTANSIVESNLLIMSFFKHIMCVLSKSVAVLDKFPTTI